MKHLQLLPDIFSWDVFLWVLPLVLISVGIGAIIGRGVALRNLTRRLRKERKSVVNALQALLANTEQLTTDVDSHNSELRSMEQNVSELTTGADLQEVQQALLLQISAVVKSNKRMEDDLVMTRYRLEEQAQELDRTRVEARTDELSGLSNRKAFDETLQFVLSQFKRKGKHFALVLADVDHFKRINDTHGHASGDRVVVKLGDALKEYTREHDHVSRFGGDEFAIILVGLDQENASCAATRIRAAVERTNFDVGLDGARIAVTLSLGMAFPMQDDTAEALFDRADKALYNSKEAGRNQLQVWNEPQAC